MLHKIINENNMNYFSLRDKNDYVSFNKILKRKIIVFR